MPLLGLFKLVGLVLTLLGLVFVVVGFAPAALASMVPAKFVLVEGFAQSVSLLGLGAMVYLLAEIAGKRPAKSY